MRSAILVLLAVALLALPACQMNERLSGTAFGGAGGLLLGAVVAETVAGALIGGVAGGVVGYLIGDYLADQRERACCPQPCPQPQPCAPQPCPQPCAPQPCAPGYGGGYNPQQYPPQQYPQQYPQQPRVGAVKAPAQAWQASQAALARGKRAPDLTQARAAYEEAVRLDPRNADAWDALGLARMMGGNRAGAEQAFREALAQDPNHYAARRNLAWATSGVR